MASQWRGNLGYAHLDRRQMAEKGRNAVVPQLGDNAVEGGGAPSAKAMSGVAPGG
jgi:hypothetical protein